MENKKSEKANLQNKKGLFFEVGLIISLAFMLLAFNWTSNKRIRLLQNTPKIILEEVPISYLNLTLPTENPDIPGVHDVIIFADDTITTLTVLKLEENIKKEITLLALIRPKEYEDYD